MVTQVGPGMGGWSHILMATIPWEDKTEYAHLGSHAGLNCSDSQDSNVRPQQAVCHLGSKQKSMYMSTTFTKHT